MKSEETKSEKRRFATSIRRHENFVLGLVLAAIITVVAVASQGKSLTVNNFRNVLLQSSIRGVASVGQAFCILTGNFDLSIGGLAAMVSMIGSRLITERPDIYGIAGGQQPVAVGLLMMILIATAVGSLNGLAVSRLRMPSLIVTLAVWQMTKGASYQLAGGYSIMYLPRSLSFFGQGAILGVPVPVIIFLAVVIPAYIVLNQTTFGRSVYAAGGNPVAAWLSGIKVRDLQLIVFVISGFLAAIASIIVLSRTMCGSMISAAGLELDTVAACAIGGLSLYGGQGSLIGVVIGVTIIGVLNNALVILGVSPALQDFVKGAVIFSAVAVDVIRRRS
ncbi:ABC transporter permease [Chloroflexota bacterium]